MREIKISLINLNNITKFMLFLTSIFYKTKLQEIMSKIFLCFKIYQNVKFAVLSVRTNLTHCE